MKRDLYEIKEGSNKDVPRYPGPDEEQLREDIKDIFAPKSSTVESDLNGQPPLPI